MKIYFKNKPFQHIIILLLVLIQNFIDLIHNQKFHLVGVYILMERVENIDNLDVKELTVFIEQSNSYELH